jgi:hypothetical protein
MRIAGLIAIACLTIAETHSNGKTPGRPATPAAPISQAVSAHQVVTIQPGVRPKGLVALTGTAHDSPGHRSASAAAIGGTQPQRSKAEPVINGTTMNHGF